MAEPKSGTSLLRRKANEVKRYRVMRRLVPVFMSAIAIFVVLVYVVSIMYAKFGGFTVSVNKYHRLQYGLSLSETKDFARPTARLNCNAKANITNIDGSTLEGIDFGAIDGEDNGADYLCYTFYCKNAGEEIINFEYVMTIANATMGVEKAVRVRLMTTRADGTYTKVDYARAAGVEDGQVIPEEGTTPFYDKNTVLRLNINNFQVGEIVKFTVVIWLEGPDLECVDSIIGGEFKVDMKFAVTGVTQNQEI